MLYAPILVIAERLQRQRLQEGLLLGEHRRHLPLGAAVDVENGAPVGARTSRLSVAPGAPAERRCDSSRDIRQAT
jgi:hypothetical protein